MEGTIFYFTLHFYPLTNIQIFISSVIKQKGESQNGCFKKTKHVKLSEKTNISNPLNKSDIPNDSFLCMEFKKAIASEKFSNLTIISFLPVLQLQTNWMTVY